MPSDGQLQMKGDDVKRNVPERKDLSQQVKLFHLSKNIFPCREGPCPASVALGSQRLLQGHGRLRMNWGSWDGAHPGRES